MSNGQIDLIDYPDKKASGIITPFKAGSTYGVSVRRWKAESGEEDEPLVIGISLKSLEEQKADLINRIAAIDVFIEDLKELDAV